MQDDIPAPLPKQILTATVRPEWLDTITDNKFSRVLVNFYIPMGEENRKKKEADKDEKAPEDAQKKED